MGYKTVVVHNTASANTEVASETIAAYRAYMSSSHAMVQQPQSSHHNAATSHHHKPSLPTAIQHTTTTEVASDTIAAYQHYKHAPLHPSLIQPIKYPSTEVPAETVEAYRALHQIHTTNNPSIEYLLHPSAQLDVLIEPNSSISSNVDYYYTSSTVDTLDYSSLLATLVY